MSSLKGQLLLDGGKLHGSYFHRTVILICQHDEQGAFGLVLNRKSETLLGGAVMEPVPEWLEKMPIYLGGPVQTSVLSYLYSETSMYQGNVLSNLEVGHSLETLAGDEDKFVATRQVRIFAGYAGWSAGQLEDEMRREAWLTHPASLDLVFHEEPEDLWRIVLCKKGWQYKLIADAPDDLSWN